MKSGRKSKWWLLGVAALGALALIWHQLRNLGSESPDRPVTDRQKRPADKPALPPSAPLANLSPSVQPKKAPLTSESIADEAYRACVLTNQVKREELLLALVAELTPENAGAFLEELMRGNRTPNKPGQTVWNAFWRKWGSIDGKTCLAELISRGQSNRKSSDGILAMEGWAASDPQGAAEWLKSEQPSVTIWNAAWAAFQISTHGGDPLAATPEILSLANTPSKMDAVSQQLADLAQLKKGAEGLMEWFGTVPEASRQGAVNHFLYRLIDSDPQAAVNFMTRNAQAAWRNDLHAGKLISEISKQDPSGTAAWAARLYPSPPETPLEQTPIFQAARRWAEQDPTAAKAWLESNAQQPWAEAAKSGYANGAPSTESEFLSSPNSPP